MNALELIQNHDKWRRNMGGAPAGVASQMDGNAYAGLDLNLITFSASTFTGSRFSATTFQDAKWTGCQFTACVFAGCDFARLALQGCTFAECRFEQCTFDGAQLADSQFLRCAWDDVTFDQAHWHRLRLLDCRGTKLVARHLHGDHNDFTGSHFEDMAFEGVALNGAMA